MVSPVGTPSENSSLPMCVSTLLGVEIDFRVSGGIDFDAVCASAVVEVCAPESSCVCFIVVSSRRSIPTCLGKRAFPQKKPIGIEAASATGKTTSSHRLTVPPVDCGRIHPYRKADAHVWHNSLRSPAPIAPSTLLPARALRLLVLACPLRSCLARLSVSIQLLNCPRRDCGLLCSGRPVGCA